MNEKLFDLVKDNLKNPKMYAIILLMGIVFFWLFPYIDANIFYYRRINDRVDILTKVSALNENIINKNEIIKSEYESILSEISEQPESTMTRILSKETSSRMTTAKFISGGIIFWIIAFACFGIKGFKNIGYKIIGFVIFVIIGIVFGFIAKSLPNVFNPWVNCVGFPIALFVIAALFITSNNKAPKHETD